VQTCWVVASRGLLHVCCPLGNMSWEFRRMPSSVATLSGGHQWYWWTGKYVRNDKIITFEAFRFSSKIWFPFLFTIRDPVPKLTFTVQLLSILSYCDGFAQSIKQWSQKSPFKQTQYRISVFYVVRSEALPRQHPARQWTSCVAITWEPQHTRMQK
jgi:hypothetical protein